MYIRFDPVLYETILCYDVGLCAHVRAYKSAWLGIYVCVCVCVCVCVRQKITRLLAKLGPWAAVLALLGLISRVQSCLGVCVSVCMCMHACACMCVHMCVFVYWLYVYVNMCCCACLCLHVCVFVYVQVLCEGVSK